MIKQIYISSKLLSNDIYKINYKDLEDFLLENEEFTEEEKDYLNTLKDYYFNIDSYSAELIKFYKDVKKYILVSLKDLEIENIHNIDKDLDGIRFYIKHDEVLKISEDIINILKKNEKLIEYYTILTYLSNNYKYTNIQEAREDFLNSLDDIKDKVKLFFDEYKKENSNFITIDLFENEGYINMCEISFYEIFDNNETGAKFSFIYELENVNSFKNTKYTFFNYNEEIFEIITNSENTKDKFVFNIRVEDEYNYIGGSFEYNKINGKLKFYDIDNIYFLNGKINKLNPGKEFNLELNFPFNDYDKGKLYINFSNDSNIVKPKNNNVIDIFKLKEDEIVEIIKMIQKNLSISF